MFLTQPIDPNQEIVQFINRYLPERSLEGGPWIGGGSVRKMMLNEPLGLSDIDVFFRTEEQFSEWVNADWRHDGRTVDCHSSVPKRGPRTRFGATYLFKVAEVSVQLVGLKTYASPEMALDDFDITAVMFLTDGKTVMMHPKALDDAKNKVMRLHRKAYKPRPERLIRYITNYGFTPLPGILSSMMGIDTEYFMPSSTLRDVNY